LKFTGGERGGGENKGKQTTERTTEPLRLRKRESGGEGIKRESRGEVRETPSSVRPKKKGEKGGSNPRCGANMV